jgi:glycolate oxidase FAD binding subunit
MAGGTLLQPATLGELSSMLAHATAERTPVRVTSYIGPGFRSGVSVTDDAHGLKPGPTYVSLSRMPSTIEHCAGDLVATIPAGISLDDANAVLARNGQWLALDPPLGGSATIGAIVATSASGPRRHRYGTPRDLIIGIEMVLSDGRIVKAGGRVVKNVAGYDLARLMCGSLGSLAVVVNATFKLIPIAPASRTVLIDASDTTSLLATLEALTSAPMTPSAVEIETPPHRLLVRFESTAAAAEQMATATAALAQRARATATIVAGDEEAAGWRAYATRTWASGVTRLKLSILPSRLGDLLSVAESLPVKYSMAGRAALGVLYLAIEGTVEQVDDTIAVMRRTAEMCSGYLAAESPTSGVSAAEVLSNPGDTLPLMQAIKSRFDPLNILNPGGGPAGL